MSFLQPRVRIVNLHHIMDPINTGKENDYTDQTLMKGTATAFSALANTTDKQNDTIPLIAMDADFITITGQKFAVLSFIDSSQYKGLKDDDGISRPAHLIKVRGVFASQSAAEKHIERMRKIDCHFDYHIVNTHKWTTIGAHLCSEQEWEDNTVNETMQNYFEKENESMANLEHRLKLSSKNTPGTQQKETDTQQKETDTDIWQQAQRLKDIDAIDGLFDGRNLLPMSLMEAATAVS